MCLAAGHVGVFEQMEALGEPGGMPYPGNSVSVLPLYLSTRGTRSTPFNPLPYIDTTKMLSYNSGGCLVGRRSLHDDSSTECFRRTASRHSYSHAGGSRSRLCQNPETTHLVRWLATRRAESEGSRGTPRVH